MLCHQSICHIILFLDHSQWDTASSLAVCSFNYNLNYFNDDEDDDVSLPSTFLIQWSRSTVSLSHYLRSSNLQYSVQAGFLYVKHGAFGLLITWDCLLLAGGWR